MPIEDVMKRVMTDVRASTRDEQRPWIATSLVGDFALVPAPNTQARLMLARPGRNVDGTPARGAAPASSDATPISTTDGKPLLQWFQTAGQDEQMMLTQQIEREAKGVNRDDLPRLERQARGGNVVAASVLGVAYRDGFGAGARVTRSSTIALRWFRLAAAQDMPYALNALGEMFYLAKSLGGTLTGEHGIGLLKRDWLNDELGQISVDLQHSIRHVFDPLGILNPGKAI
jgi:hypothetical protein